MPTKSADIVSNNVRAAYLSLLGDIDKKFSLSGDFSPLRLSTSLIAVDYICNGGLVPGMTTFSGFEGSAKSSLCTETIAECLRVDIPYIRWDDAESTVDGVYVSNILQQPLSPLIPKWKKGKLANNPRIWYSQNNIIEVFYDSVVQTLENLPDKVFHKESKQWFYRVDKKTTNPDFLKAFKDLKADSNLSRGSKLYYPAPNNAPQGAIFLDSYPTMVTATQAKKQEANNMPTGPAIAFAANIPRITGFFKRKCIILVGVNQMRKRPGMAFGNPEYEARGETLKLWSNNRLLMREMAVPKEWQKPDAKTSRYTSEPSVEYKGAVDRFAYKRIQNIKLKHGTPYLECWGRVWIRDGQEPGQGRGFCKTFDTFEYMRLNNLAELTKEKGKLHIQFKNLSTKKGDHPLSKRLISWHDFKVLVLNEHLVYKTEYFKECFKETMKRLKLKDEVKLREFCKKHLQAQTKVEL